MKAFTAVLILFFSTAAFAGGIDTVISPPSNSPQAGWSTEFSVYFHNSENTSLPADIPERVSCRLTSGNSAVEVEAYSVSEKSRGTVTICAGCFEKIRYTLAIPATIEGTVTMEIPDFGNARTMFAVKSSPLTIGSKSDETAPKKFEDLDSLLELYQPYLKNIAAYEPMYFLVGTDPDKSKFQFSFKYRLFNPERTFSQEHSWVNGFHFAYTQTSFWDLKSSSKPFDDTSYKPEFFFQSPNIRIPWSTGFFVKGGIQHESNGRGGEESRSTNFLYLKPIYIAYDDNTKLGIMIAPKIWAYLANEDENNPDLKDFRGYFDLETKIGKANSFVLGTHFRWAREGGSIELDLTYPLHRFIFKNLDLYFHAQYVSALAESLLNYRDRTEAFRLGFAIVR